MKSAAPSLVSLFASTVVFSNYAAFLSSFFNLNHRFEGQYAAAMAPNDVPLQNNPGTLTPDQLRHLVIGA
jgi:hypothetical protein